MNPTPRPPQADAPARPPRPTGRGGRRLGWGLLGAAAVLAGTVVVSDLMGWPYLAGPVQRHLASVLARPVSLSDMGQSSLRLHLLFGGPRVEVGHAEFGAPTAGDAPVAALRQFSATELVLRGRWRDVLAGWRGQGWHLAEVRANTLALELQPDRSAPARPDAAGAPPGWSVGRLLVRDGRARVVDASHQLDVDLQFRGRLGADEGSPSPAGAASVPAGREGREGGDGEVPAGLVAQAQGRYREAPVRGEARIDTPQGGLGSDAGAWPAHLTFEAGRVKLQADGRLVPEGGRWRLEARYRLAGPSLAAVGDPLQVTLPATPSFTLDGSLRVADGRWHTEVASARIGSSRLAGVFDYGPVPGSRPRLAGRLVGQRLVLTDLAPAVGATPGAAPRAGGRVLPDRSFDLPSLRAMDAEVQIALDSFDAGSERLRDVRPLKARLKLVDGVLTLDEIDARVADGRIGGLLQLDGREAVGRLKADLQLRGVALERWIAQPRAGNAPPYVSGRLGASIRLAGRGRSTAQLLGSADGQVSLWLRDGRLSHLALEAGGLDLAQALGVAIRGDDALPVACGAADLSVRDGMVTPTVAVVDTRDSTVMLVGGLSLATERLDLVVHVAPKDASPLALRSPVHVKGSFDAPQVSIETAPLLRRLVPAAVLATVNPLAALLPLIDLGDDDARAAAQACRSALVKSEGRTRGSG